MTTLADLIAEVVAEHIECRVTEEWHLDRYPNAHCDACNERWGDNGCKPARLAAALSVENVAAGVARAIAAAPDRHMSLEDVPCRKAAAALLAAMTVETQASEPVSHAHVDVVGWTCPRCGHVS